jgi:hypothetical protein
LDGPDLESYLTQQLLFVIVSTAAHGAQQKKQVILGEENWGGWKKREREAGALLVHI